jgi:toxin ParE1/3/4
MSLPVVLRPEAQADLLAARDWYEQRRPGLGEAFADAVEQLLARIQAMPQLYRIAGQDVRWGKVRKYPYVIYFRMLPDRIEVIAVLHGFRDPRAWQDRS